MVSFLKERDPKTIDDIRKAAELFISSRPNAKLAKEPKVSSLVAVRQDKKGQGFVSGQHFSTQFQNRPTYSSRSQSVPRISNNDNFNSQGPSQGSYGETPRWSRRGTFYGQSSYPSFRSRGTSSRGLFTSNQFSRGGRGYHRGAAGFKQMGNSYHAASSSFMKSPNQQAKALRLFSGTVNGKHCSVLRDTGCNCVGVSKRLLLPDDYLGKKEKCKLFMGEVELDTVAVHISTPFYKGKIVGFALDDPIADVVLGNIDGLDDKPLLDTLDLPGNDDGDHKGDKPRNQNDGVTTLAAVSTRSSTKQLSSSDQGTAQAGNDTLTDSLTVLLKL